MGTKSTNDFSFLGPYPFGPAVHFDTTDRKIMFCEFLSMTQNHRPPFEIHPSQSRSPICSSPPSPPYIPIRGGGVLDVGEGG